MAYSIDKFHDRLRVKCWGKSKKFLISRNSWQIFADNTVQNFLTPTRANSTLRMTISFSALKRFNKICCCLRGWAALEMDFGFVVNAVLPLPYLFDEQLLPCLFLFSGLHSLLSDNSFFFHAHFIQKFISKVIHLKLLLVRVSARQTV